MAYDYSEIIKKGYLDLYKDHSPEKITVNMICVASHISRSSFYKTFPNADEVLSAIEKDVFGELISIYEDYNYQNFMDIDPDLPSPNFVEAFRCVMRNKDFFEGAFSVHGNQSYYSQSKKAIYQNIEKSIKQYVDNERQLQIICDFSSEYMLLCCKRLIRYSDILAPRTMAINMKNYIVDFVKNKDLLIPVSETGNKK